MKNNGITLIALIITIIILVIIAGVGITFLVGENGILNKSKFAKESYDNGVIIENQRLDKLNEILSGSARGDSVSNQSNIITSVDFNVTYTSADYFNISITTVATDSTKILGYHIYAVSKSDSSIVGNMSVNANLQIKGLKQSTTYSIYVIAYDINNNYKLSQSKEFTTSEAEYLFYKGDLRTQRTGGWTGYYSGGNNPGVGRYQIGDTLIAETWGTWCSYTVRTNNLIDLTDYSKLIIKYDYRYTNAASYAISNSGVLNSAISGWIKDDNVSEYLELNNQIKEIDISQVNTTGYIAVNACNGARLVVSEIYLQK